MDHTPEHKTDYAALYGNPTNNMIMIMLSFTKFVTLILFRDARKPCSFSFIPRHWRRKYLKSFLMEESDLFILQSQYHGC